jgi:hypothetical protein
MADQADVETALAALAANALYPDGTSATSAVGVTCRVYRGFPSGPTLDADLAAGIVHVSVAAAGEVKNMTRYPRVWRPVAPVPASLAVTVGARTAVFSGVCAVGQLAGVAVDGALFPYAVQASDTPATVASNLAALLRAAGWIVVYAGSTMTVPNTQHFVARVVNGAGALQEIKRQVQDFHISLWCPNPGVRDAVAPVIDEALAALTFIALADGSAARLIFAGTQTRDDAADAVLYRRDITYSAEYPTTLAQMTPAMLFGTAGFTADAVFVENLTS